MSALILAASAGALVEQIGSYAGLACILGLGIMSLLYFSQAREVRRLREWAGREPERAAEIAERVQADPQRRVVAQPIQQPATPAAQQQQATAALYASVGATPPGVIAPAGQLARPAATPAAGLLPAPGSVPQQPGTGDPVAPGVGAAAAGAAAAGAAAAAAGAAAAAPAAPAAGTPGPPPAPGTVSTPTPPVPASPGLGASATPSPIGQPAAATAAAAAARTAAAASSPPLSAYANGSTGQDTHESAAARPELLLSDRDNDDNDDGGLSMGRVATFIGGGIAAVLVVVVLVVVLTGGDETQPPNDFGNTPAQESEAPAATPNGSGSGGTGSSGLTAAERRATKVAVLNGTTQSGLARNVGDKIEKARFTIESVGNNVDQQIPTTVVSYTSGNETAARAVAKLVGVDTGAVQPADANAAAAADADVVVTVGLDQSG